MHIVAAAAKVVGTDGQKMSKSYGNAIDIFEEPKKFSKKNHVDQDGFDARLRSRRIPDRYSVFALYSLSPHRLSSRHWPNAIGLVEWVMERRNRPFMRRRPR